MKLDNSRRTQLLIAMVYIVFALLVFSSTWQVFMQKPWAMNTDAIQFGSIINQNINPDLFPTDFAFQSDRYTNFYTPSFVQISTFLTQISGDYILSLSLTQLPLALIYFFVAHLVYYQVTKSHVISILFVLLSIIGIASVNSEWELSGLFWMLPRTYALPALLLAFLVFLKIYKIPTNPDISLRNWLIFGLAIGFTANFHPTTGMTLAMCMGSIALAQTLKTGKPGWSQIIVLVVGTLIGGMPTIIHVIGNSNIAHQGNFRSFTSQEFREFAEIFEWRIRAYPFKFDFGRGWTSDSSEIQFLIRFPWLTLTLVSWFLATVNHRSKSALLFMATQCVYIWLFVDNIDEVAMSLIIGFTLYCWWNRDDHRLMFLYEWIAGILLVLVTMPMIMRPLWLHFELWSLTTVVVELSRVAKQLHIPITLILAYLSVELWNRWYGLSISQIAMRFMLVFVAIINLNALILMIVVNIVYDRLYDKFSQQRLYLNLLAMIISGLVIGVVVHTTFPFVSTYFRFDRILLYQPSHYTVLVGATLALVIWFIIRRRSGASVSGQILALAIGMLLASIGQFALIYSKGYERDHYPIVEIAEWAQAETPIDALFIVYENLLLQSQFRLFSQRSIHYSSKDLNIIGYAHPEDLSDQYNRYLRLLEMKPTNGDELIAVFQSEPVDYVILNNVEIEESPAYEVVQQIDNYKVYTCAEACK